MGAEYSVDGFYTLGEAFESDNKYWTIYPAVNKTDGNISATVFIHDSELENEGYMTTDKSLKYLRTLRHPGLLKCEKVFESSAEVSVVTEPLVPLQNVLGEQDIHEVIAGIHSVVTAVIFLHDKCKLSHNNLCLDSIFVGQNDACWKIGALECMTSFNEMTKEVMENIKPFRNIECLPPNSGDVILAHGQDTFGLGKLIVDILDQIEIPDNPEVDHFRKTIETNFLNSHYQERSEIKSILNDDIFQDGYTEILNFLNNITVKSSEEKADFFSHLHYKLKDLPSDIVANRLLHLLLSRFVLVDPVAVEIFLPHLLTPLSDKELEIEQSMDIIPLLPVHLYKQCCLPILSKLFEVNDRHVRLILLKYFHLYVGMFEKDVLQDVILTQLNVGLRDCDDELVSATFSALQFLVPLLGSQVVLGGVGTKQFTDRRPKFSSQAPRLNEFQNDDELQNNHYLLSNADNMTLLTKSKLSTLNNETEEEKVKERERRKQETKRRNDERRKKSRLLKMEKEMTKKVTKVEEIQVDSDEDFETWPNLSADNDLNVEISDGSEYGRPSSSEISLDSGYSEKPRFQSSLVSPISPPHDKPYRPLDKNTDSKTIKLNTAMKLNKKLNKPKQQEARTTNADLPSLRQNEKFDESQKNHSIVHTKTVDIPWDDFDIKVVKTLDQDIFSDMTPAITFVEKVPVKGTSMYSNTLAVDNTSDEVAGDGWMDDDW